jgi:hypothetical protein
MWHHHNDKKRMMPIICNAKIAGAQFYDMVCKQPLQGCIHSVFDRVVNMEVPVDNLPDTLFSFGREDVSIAPAMLVTDVGKDMSMGSLGLKQGDRFDIHAGYLSISGLYIRTSGVQVWKPVDPADFQHAGLCSKRELTARIYEISKALNTNNRGTALPSAVLNQATSEFSYYDMTASRKLVVQANHLLQHSLNGTHPGDAIDALLGFGLGLTPSGDDIIAGYLYGLCYVERYTGNEAAWRGVMINNLKQKLSMTNRISRHFLRYAMMGLWSKDIESFLLDMTGMRTINCMNSAQRLTSFGASSGYDILTGICIGLIAGYRSLIKE